MAIKLSDLNNDNILDIIVANYGGNSTNIFIGHGNGSFVRGENLLNGNNSGAHGIGIGDINNDTQIDIIIVYRKSSILGIFLGYGNGSFQNQLTFSTGINSTPAEVCIDNLNNDNLMDVIISDHQNDRLILLMGFVNQTFLNNLTLFTGTYSGPYIVLTNELNGDGYIDIVVGNGDGNNIMIFYGDQLGRFSKQIKYTIESGPYAFVIHDFNNDNIKDIITANYYGNSTTVLLGNGIGDFRIRSSYSTGIDSLPYAIDNADFNKDNIQDIITPNSGLDNVAILLAYGNGRFENARFYSTGLPSTPVDIATGDLNQDNKTDFITVNNNTNNIAIFLNTCH